MDDLRFYIADNSIINIKKILKKEVKNFFHLQLII